MAKKAITTRNWERLQEWVERAQKSKPVYFSAGTPGSILVLDLEQKDGTNLRLTIPATNTIEVAIFEPTPHCLRMADPGEAVQETEERS